MTRAVRNTKGLCRSNRTASASLHPAHNAAMRSASARVRSREGEQIKLARSHSDKAIGTLSLDHVLTRANLAHRPDLSCKRSPTTGLRALNQPGFEASEAGIELARCSKHVQEDALNRFFCFVIIAEDGTSYFQD